VISTQKFQVSDIDINIEELGSKPNLTSHCTGSSNARYAPRASTAGKSESESFEFPSVILQHFETLSFKHLQIKRARISSPFHFVYVVTNVRRLVQVEISYGIFPTAFRPLR
jgi:hypothetical protein